MGRNPKRKSSRGTAGEPQAKRPRSSWISSPFGQMLEGAGMAVSGGQEANELSVEPAVFQRQLTSVFRRHSNLDQAVEEFCDGLFKYIEDPVRFRMCLLPTKIAEGADVMTRSAGLDSLLRLLLGVEYIQPSVAGVLLEKLTEYMDSTGNVDGMGPREYHQMPHLILSQLRWLDHVVKGKDLCSQLLEVAGIAPVGVQREIITSLPEILEDSQHNDTAKELKSLLQTNSDLTAAIIDALSNLNIATDLAAEILDVALGCVRSADLSDLPTVIRFIMLQVSPKNALEVISELREKLDFDSIFIPRPSASSTPRGTQRYANKISSETSDQFVVFDTIRSSICFQKAVAEGWMKAIDQVSEAADHRVVDVFVLFILHSIPGRKKTVESLFSRKIRHSLFTEDLMANVFGSHAGALREFFSSILSLCEALLCSTSPTITTFAANLYQHLFSTFDVYCQQEVIGALITHVGSGMPSEIDHALDILNALVEHHCSALLKFTILIKGVLDYLEHLSVPQIRRLYSVLSLLAFHDPEETSSIQDEMHTLIRKQLSHTEQKYCRMGVIGAVMVIQQMARRRDTTDLTLQRAVATQDEIALPAARRRQAVSMLDDVMQSCSLSPETTILFCDEMASVVRQGTMDHGVLQHLCDKITTKFQDIFLIESTDTLPTDVGLPLELAYNLDVVEEASIALNLMPGVVQPGENGQERGAVLRAMAVKFRLLRMCEQTLNGNLEGIDALLGCPVVMCSKDRLNSDVLEDLPVATRHSVCLSLFHCINWFRELVCAFAGEVDPDMKGKVIIRLMNITELQSLLESCMAVTPGFWPPCVNPEEVVLHPKVKKGKSGKSDTTMASVTSTTQNVDKDTTSLDKTATTPSSTVPIDRLRPYFRELDLGVFATLHYSPLSRTLVDSEEHTREREELTLRPPQLLFLLQDLNSKLSRTFSAFGAKASGSTGGVLAFTPDQLVATMTGLVPDLCEHLENTSAFFQAQLAESDGMVDAESSHQDFPALCTALHLLLKTMAIFFGWSSLSDPHYATQLRESVKAIVARTSQSSSQLQASLPQLARLAFKYLSQFSEFLPTLTSAHSLAKLLVAVCRTCKADHIRHSIAEVCGQLLKRPWREGEGRQQRNEVLEFLLKYHMEWAGDSLTVIEGIVGDAVTELIGEEPVEESQAYPTLSNATIPCYYRSMMSTLVSRIKSIPPPSKKTAPTPEALDDRLHVLEVSTKILFMLVNVVKSFDRRSILSAALKFGRLYVEAFLRSGMPVLDSLFRQRKDDVTGVLKSLQQSTRCLQHFCGHSKVTKDLTLTNHVPQLKKTLEMLLYKVKELLTNHNCAEAFWLGNLKNRDLQGHEILSQASQAQQSSEPDNESEGDGTNSTSTDRRDEILDSDED